MRPFCRHTFGDFLRHFSPCNYNFHGRARAHRHAHACTHARTHARTHKSKSRVEYVRYITGPHFDLKFSIHSPDMNSSRHINFENCIFYLIGNYSDFLIQHRTITHKFEYIIGSVCVIMLRLSPRMEINSFCPVRNASLFTQFILSFAIISQW
jgi:hypothetical protein